MVHHRNLKMLAGVAFILIFSMTAVQAEPPAKPGNPGLPGCLTKVNELEQIIPNQNLTILGLQEQIYNLQASLDAMEHYALVPKTGQAFSYGPGDDGSMQHGVPWPVPSFVIENGTVKDNLTGLIWLRENNCGGHMCGRITALAQVQEFNTSGTMNAHDCGDTNNQGSHQTDWRIPNIKELQSLIDYNWTLPALSNTAGTARWVQGDPFFSVEWIRGYLSCTMSPGGGGPLGVFFETGATSSPGLGLV